MTASVPFEVGKNDTGTVVAGMSLTITPSACTECGEQATCAYSYGGPSYYGCAAHDPTRQPSWATGPSPQFFTYRTVGAFTAVQHTTGHLAVAPLLTG